MRIKSLFIVSLLAVFIAAPIVDAIACDDCRDIIPLQHEQQPLTNEDGQAAVGPAPSDAGHPVSQEAGEGQDLCPVCANTAAAMGNTCFCAPSTSSDANHLPKLITFSDPSYPIIKPPQN